MVAQSTSAAHQRLTPAPLPNFPATKHGFQLGRREATRKCGEVKTLPWRPYLTTVGIVAAVVVVACHAAGIPPSRPCNSRSPSDICTHGRGTKHSRSCAKMRWSSISIISAPSSHSSPLFLPCHPCAFADPSHCTGIGLSAGGQVRHLGQGMHTAVTSRVHCPRFKDFKDVARGLEASWQVRA